MRVGEELGTPRGGGPMSSVLPKASQGRGLRRREMQRKRIGDQGRGRDKRDVSGKGRDLGGGRTGVTVSLETYGHPQIHHPACRRGEVDHVPEQKDAFRADQVEVVVRWWIPS